MDQGKWKYRYLEREGKTPLVAMYKNQGQKQCEGKYSTSASIIRPCAVLT